MCETCRLPTAPNRQPPLRAQSQRAARADAKLAVSRIRQNATESDEAQRKLVRARAREATAFRSPFSRHGLRPGRSGLGVSFGVAVP